MAGHQDSIYSIIKPPKVPLPEPSDPAFDKMDTPNSLHTPPHLAKFDGDDSVGHSLSSAGFYTTKHGGRAYRDYMYHVGARLAQIPPKIVPVVKYDKDINKTGQYSGKSIAEHPSDGKNIIDFAGDGVDSDDSSAELSALKTQWTSGELLELWALAYIMNDTDTMSHSFVVTPRGVVYLHGDGAFFDLPYGKLMEKSKTMGVTQKDAIFELPSFVKSFVSSSGLADSEGISPNYKQLKPNLQAVREWASGIDTNSIQVHLSALAAERAIAVQGAFQELDPVNAMKELWTKPQEIGQSNASETDTESQPQQPPSR
jgi:hypothetical protein